MESTYRRYCPTACGTIGVAGGDEEIVFPAQDNLVHNDQ